MTEPLHKLTAKERDDRWRRAHHEQIGKRKAMLERDMSPADAERKATRMQEAVTNRARAQTEGRP